jgi:hypothetical protein
MPGTLARHYAARGGQVVLMGKPAPAIYEVALGMLGLPADQVIAVGDSLEHDIGGAQAAGVDAMFVLGGIHREDVQLEQSDSASDGSEDGASSSGGSRGGSRRAGKYRFSEQGLANACLQHGVQQPQYVMPYFAW